jgi:hypothetical protein
MAPIDRCVGLGVSYTAEALWPERLAAWELGGLPRPQTVFSAAPRARPIRSVRKTAAEFPFPDAKMPPDSGGK